MITGSIVAIITPMHADGSLDLPACAAWSISTFRKAPTPSSSSAPPASRRRSTVEEHCELIRVAVDQAAGRLR
jgi:4-hydroxy-tetrahydrodipicolinate synthase